MQKGVNIVFSVVFGSVALDPHSLQLLKDTSFSDHVRVLHLLVCSKVLGRSVG